MNTTLKLTAVALSTAVLVGAFALLGTGLAQAQGGSPWNGYGKMAGSVTPMPGMMGGGYGMHGNGQAMMAGVDTTAMHAWMTNTGGMHTQVWASLAETLNLTPDELSTQLASGQTLVQIAEAQGVSQEQLTTALQAARTTSLQQAVTDGVLTQAQADQMSAFMSTTGTTMFTHMGAMGGGFGPGRQVQPTTPQTVP